jgi:hypothetical protein
MAKRKSTKDKLRSTKHTHKTKDRVTRTPLNTECELRCSGRVSSSCSTSGTRRVNLVTNPGWVITSTVLWSQPWLGWPLWYVCVINDHGYVPLVVSTSRSFPHSWLITGFVTILTRRVPLVEQELLTLPEHLSFAPIGMPTLYKNIFKSKCPY